MDGSRSTPLVLLLATVAIAATVPTPPAPRPNLVFILVDDLDVGTFEAIPEFRPLLQDEGTQFTNAFVSLSLCCPSRAATLRGQYAHNNGIFWNKGRRGGYHAFVETGDETSTLPVWLRDAGYDTALMGKYLNGYPDPDRKSTIAPGWTEWDVPAAGDPYGEFAYTLNENGRMVRYGRGASAYLGDVLAEKASAWITHEAALDRPFFLALTPYAPHGPATPAPRYAGLYADVTYPRSAAFDEADVRDKPSWIRARERLDPAELARTDERYRMRLRATRGLVDVVAAVVHALEDAGVLDRTWIIFTSDNGFHIGEHRLRAGKNTGYDTDLRVPLVVRGPGVPRGARDDRLVVNIDHAPTLAALAGVVPPAWVDGRSLVPLLVGPAGAPWRDAFLLEHRGPGHEDGAPPEVPEPPDPGDTGETAERDGGMPVFTGIRTPTASYIEYANGERELYDLVRDPLQLENLAGTAPAEVLDPLRRRLADLRVCQGETCRTADRGGP